MSDLLTKKENHLLSLAAFEFSIEHPWRRSPYLCGKSLTLCFRNTLSTFTTHRLSRLSHTEWVYVSEHLPTSLRLLVCSCLRTYILKYKLFLNKLLPSYFSFVFAHYINWKLCVHVGYSICEVHCRIVKSVTRYLSYTGEVGQMTLTATAWRRRKWTNFLDDHTVCGLFLRNLAICFLSFTAFYAKWPTNVQQL